MERNDYNIVKWCLIGIPTAIWAIVFTVMFWEPILAPWTQESQGKANLRQAAQERQIVVQRAQGELDAAEATAEAIITMGQAARDFPEYRGQAFTTGLAQAMSNGSIRNIIFIPVEAPMPIHEAGTARR